VDNFSSNCVILAPNGTVLHAYEACRTADIRGLAVDEGGNVLVADRANNRLLVIDQSLSSAHEISVCVDGGLQGPQRLRYDQSHRRLYIGEDRKARVIVIDNVKDLKIN